MKDLSNKAIVVIIGFFVALGTYLATSVVHIQDYTISKRPVPTVLPTVAVSPTQEATPSATVIPTVSTVRKPFANPTK